MQSNLTEIQAAAATTQLNDLLRTIEEEAVASHRIADLRGVRASIADAEALPPFCAASTQLIDHLDALLHKLHYLCSELCVPPVVAPFPVTQTSSLLARAPEGIAAGEVLTALA